jgi:uncharacterized membrane protein YjgN (DUF898 family)
VLAFGRSVALKFSPPRAEQRVTAISSFCISLALALLVNVLVAVLHTVLLKVAVPTLYAGNDIRIATLAMNSLYLTTLVAAFLTFTAVLLVARFILDARRQAD